MAADLLYFTGPAVEPVNSRSWQQAHPDARKAYYAALGQKIIKRMRWLMARGKDRFGEKMPPRQRPRSDGANGPVLSPHRADSRNQRLLAAYPTAKGVRITWRASGRLSWRRIMDYHGEGLVIGAYLRDQRGVTESQLASAVREQRQEWTLNHPYDRLTPPTQPPAAPALPFAIPPRRPVAPPAAARPQLRADALQRPKVATPKRQPSEKLAGWRAPGLTPQEAELVRKYPWMRGRIGR